jgi:hypothetical protein
LHLRAQRESLPLQLIVQQQRHTLTSAPVHQLPGHSRALNQRPPLARCRLARRRLALAAHVTHGELRARRVGAQRLGKHEQPLLVSSKVVSSQPYVVRTM